LLIILQDGFGKILSIILLVLDKKITPTHNLAGQAFSSHVTSTAG
jgi:hypothetical protein